MELLKELNRLNNLNYGLVGFSTGSHVTAYCFMTTIAELKEGDMLVVRTKNGFEIAYFYEYTESKDNIKRATNWIVDKVNIEEYTANVKAFEDRSNT